MEAIQTVMQKRSLPVFFWGLLISFLGSLPPGTTNILMIQLAATEGYFVSSWFALGCMVAEVICVFVCVKVMDRINRSRLLIKSLEWVSLLVITWLVVSSFASVKDPEPLDLPSIPGHLSPFIFGLMLMIVNPVQIPFWVGWTTILIERKTLPPDGHDNIQYVIGIALGSLLASAIFIAGGHAISGWIAGRQALMQWIFGLALATIAVTQVVKIVRRRMSGQSQGQ